MTDEQYKKATHLVNERESWFQRFKEASECAIKINASSPILVEIHGVKMYIKEEYIIESLNKHMKFCTDRIDELNEKIKAI